MADREGSWRQQRMSGVAAIAASLIASAILWVALLRFLPSINGTQELGTRMIVALKCVAAASLFTLVAGVEAVAHERFQTAAFDPLAGRQSERLRVNLRYLQNTLEQFVIFAVGLVGLALYLPGDGGSMRVVPATTIVWVLNRLVFWVGYHRSAAMRALGAASMAIGLIMLLYVTARIGNDLGGPWGTILLVGLYLALEALLFWKTR